MARLLRRDPRARALADLRRRDVVPTREGWLVDLAADQRLHAIGLLVDDEGDDVTRALLELLDDPLDDVRAAAIRALGSRGSDAGARACAREAPAWEADRFAFAREAAWEVLAHAHADDIAELLAASLLSRAAVGPLDDAAAALAEVVARRADRAEAALAVVVPRLGDRDPVIAARAALLATTLGAGHEEHLVAALDDDARAAHAARALGELGSLASVAPLADLLRSGRPAPGRAAAAHALGAIGGQDATRVLRAAADDQDARVRRAVAESLAPLAGVFPADSGAGPESRLLLLPAAEPSAPSNGNGNGRSHVELAPEPRVDPEPEVQADTEVAVSVEAPAVEDTTPPAEEDLEPEPPQAAVVETVDPAEKLDELEWDEIPDDFEEDLGELEDLDDDDDLTDVDDDVAFDDPLSEDDGQDAAEDDEVLAEEPDTWSGPNTDGAPAVGPRLAPARASAAPRRRVSSSAPRRPWPRGPRPVAPPEPDAPHEPTAPLEPVSET